MHNSNAYIRKVLHSEEAQGLDFHKGSFSWEPNFGPGSGLGMQKVPGKFVIPSVKVQVRIILVSAICQQKTINKWTN